VDDALNRYRTAFEGKDPEALKSIWPGLGRSELTAFQNFFKIAHHQTAVFSLGEAEIKLPAPRFSPPHHGLTDERGACRRGSDSEHPPAPPATAFDHHDIAGK
jgi:hypothetical protein